MSTEPERTVSFVDAASPRVAPPAAQTLRDSVDTTFGELIESVAASDRMLASVSAWRAQLIDQARQWSELQSQALSQAQSTGQGSKRAGGWDAATIAHRELVSELACALRIPERSADYLVTTSQVLVHQLPGTLRSLGDGELSYRHAQSLVDHAKSLPAESLEEFETVVLPFAKTHTVAKLDRKALQVRERMHPESIEKRKQAAVEERAVHIETVRDGMAWLNAYLPAEQALGIDDRLAQLAGILKTEGEERTLAQLRADIFCDLLVDGEISISDGPRDNATQGTTGLGRGVRARVLVTVPVMTLLGHGNGHVNEPAKLEGYGPIDTETARRLSAHAPSFTRLLTHPETGAVLSVGQDKYVVPKDLRTWLRVRDETCRFPGCCRRAGGCEVDHTVDWQYNGETRHDNLAHLCSSHHHLKHQTKWQVTNSRDGTLTWTSPAGRKYTTSPAVEVRAPG
jgi:Domain of unknown function (DUF222)